MSYTRCDLCFIRNKIITIAKLYFFYVLIILILLWECAIFRNYTDIDCVCVCVYVEWVWARVSMCLYAQVKKT